MTSVLFAAVDPSITLTALVIMRCNDDGYEVIDKVSLSTRHGKYKDRFRKKVDMSDLFQIFMDKHIDNIAFCVFENYSYGSPGHLADLGEMNGLLKKYLFDHNIPIDVVAPKSVKKVVSGSGNASKELVAKSLHKWITNYDDIKWNNLDETDAAAVGISYSEIMKEAMKENESEKNRKSNRGSTTIPKGRQSE